MVTTATPLESAITTSFEDATVFHGDLGLTSGAWRDRILTTLKKSDVPGGRRHGGGRSSSDCTAAICTWRPRVPQGSSPPGAGSRRCTRDTSMSWCGASRETRCRRPRWVKRCWSICSCPTAVATAASPRTTAAARSRPGCTSSSPTAWPTSACASGTLSSGPGDVPDVADRSVVGEMEADMRARRYGPALVESLRAVCRRSERTRVPDARLAISDAGSCWKTWRVGCPCIRRRCAGSSSACRIEFARTLSRPSPTPTASTTTAINECLDEVVQDESMSVSLLGLIRDALPAGGGAAGAGTAVAHRVTLERRWRSRQRRRDAAQRVGARAPESDCGVHRCDGHGASRSSTDASVPSCSRK